MSTSAIASVSSLASEPADAGEARLRASEFARSYVDFAWRMARRLGLSPADAEDVAQRAILVASQRVDAIQEGRERAFVFRTVSNLASKVRRTRQRRPESQEASLDSLAADEHTPETLLEQRRAREILDAILAALGPDLRAAFVLFEIEGLTQVEIAAALGVPLGTVASRLRRAREAFTRVAQRRGLLVEGSARERAR